MKNIYLSSNNGQEGPFEIADLKSHNINSDTMVWFEGMADWKRASEVNEFKDYIISTPPPLHKEIPPDTNLNKLFELLTPPPPLKQNTPPPINKPLVTNEVKSSSIENQNNEKSIGINKFINSKLANSIGFGIFFGAFCIYIPYVFLITPEQILNSSKFLGFENFFLIEPLKQEIIKYMIIGGTLGAVSGSFKESKNMILKIGFVFSGLLGLYLGIEKAKDLYPVFALNPDFDLHNILYLQSNVIILNYIFWSFTIGDILSNIVNKLSNK